MQKIHLPIIANSDKFSANADLLLREYINLFKSDPLQGRKIVIEHPVLMAVAHERALDMSMRNYFGHTDPDGFGPNWHVRNAGYVLPEWYHKEPHANNIESIGGGFSNAQDLMEGFKSSPGHMKHILGLSEFYQEQTNIGVGVSYHTESKYKPIWVIITCHKE